MIMVKRAMVVAGGWSLEKYRYGGTIPQNTTATMIEKNRRDARDLFCFSNVMGYESLEKVDLASKIAHVVKYGEPLRQILTAGGGLGNYDTSKA